MKRRKTQQAMPADSSDAVRVLLDTNAGVGILGCEASGKSQLAMGFYESIERGLELQEAYRSKIFKLVRLNDFERIPTVVLIEEPETSVHPSSLGAVAKLMMMAALVESAKIGRKITRLMRQMWAAMETAHSQMVVRKKGTQQSASRGRGQGIRTWVPAIFESDLSSEVPIKMNVHTMPYTRGLLMGGTSSSAAVRREQHYATPVATHVRAVARFTRQPTFA